MTGDRRRSVGLLGALLLLATPAASAVLPAIPTVPADLTPSERAAKLRQTRSMLLLRERALAAEIHQQQTQCASVEEAETHCADWGARLQAQFNALAAEIASFENELSHPSDIPRSQGVRTIGSAAAVQGEVMMIFPSGKEVPLRPGRPVFFNARIKTGPTGKLQILLLDETVFAAGPNADLVLDEFVYDPNTSSMSGAIRVTKGVFRFVTGKVVRRYSDNLRIKLHVGDLGPRGTDIQTDVASDQSAVVRVFDGSVDYFDPGGALRATIQKGQQVRLSSTGRAGPIEPVDRTAALAMAQDDDGARRAGRRR